jgi:hypothetical protein
MGSASKTQSLGADVTIKDDVLTTKECSIPVRDIVQLKILPRADARLFAAAIVGIVISISIVFALIFLNITSNKFIINSIAITCIFMMYYFGEQYVFRHKVVFKVVGGNKYRIFGDHALLSRFDQLIKQIRNGEATANYRFDFAEGRVEQL